MRFFGRLGLSDTNSGVFAGQWLDGSGGDLVSENPTTTDAIAVVAQGQYQRV